MSGMSWIIRISLLGFGFIIAWMIFSVPLLQRVERVKRTSEIKINDQIIVAEVVSSEESRARGLAGRDSLGVNEGMLFVFEEKGRHGIWMKGMRFPIDIIWISGDSIVGIEHFVEPEPEKAEHLLTIYYPPEPVNKVLEISSGRAQLLRAKVGDEVKVRPIVSL